VDLAVAIVTQAPADGGPYTFNDQVRTGFFVLLALVEPKFTGATRMVELGQEVRETRTALITHKVVDLGAVANARPPPDSTWQQALRGRHYVLHKYLGTASAGPGQTEFVTRERRERGVSDPEPSKVLTDLLSRLKHRLKDERLDHIVRPARW
jgi:hypothetical protein